MSFVTLNVEVEHESRLPVEGGNLHPNPLLSKNQVIEAQLVSLYKCHDIIVLGENTFLYIWHSAALVSLVILLIVNTNRNISGSRQKNVCTMIDKSVILLRIAQRI